MVELIEYIEWALNVNLTLDVHKNNEKKQVTIFQMIYLPNLNAVVLFKPSK